MPSKPSQIHYHWREFLELTVDELYMLMHLRQQVFVVEQQCAYLDADNLDKQASHLLCLHQEHPRSRMIGCLRLLPPGTRFSTPAIGRLATSQEARKQGIAREMMILAIQHTSLVYPGQDISLSTQCYLKEFYLGLGFSPTSSPYDEDGILHIDMVRHIANTDLSPS